MIRMWTDRPDEGSVFFRVELSHNFCTLDWHNMT
jgi:hypothetical protein